MTDKQPMECQKCGRLTWADIQSELWETGKQRHWPRHEQQKSCDGMFVLVVRSALANLKGGES